MATSSDDSCVANNILPRTTWGLFCQGSSFLYVCVCVWCVCAHTCMCMCVWLCITNKLWWQNVCHLCTQEISHSCSCLSCASILIGDTGQSSQGSKEQQAPAWTPVKIFNNTWFLHVGKRSCLHPILVTSTREDVFVSVFVCLLVSRIKTKTTQPISIKDCEGSNDLRKNPLQFRLVPDQGAYYRGNSSWIGGWYFQCVKNGADWFWLNGGMVNNVWYTFHLPFWNPLLIQRAVNTQSGTCLSPCLCSHCTWPESSARDEAEMKARSLRASLYQLSVSVRSCVFFGAWLWREGQWEGVG